LTAKKETSYRASYGELFNSVVAPRVEYFVCAKFSHKHTCIDAGCRTYDPRRSERSEKDKWFSNAELTSTVRPEK
jgi:hypothetical protein